MTLTREQFTTLIEKLEFFLTLVGEIGCRGPQGQGMLEYIGGALKRDDEESLSAGLQSIAGSLNSIAQALDETNRIRRVGLSATENFYLRAETASAGGFELFPSDTDETVHEFLNDWFILSDDSDAWVTRRRVNELYAFWCENNLISPEDRVTTSVLRRSLQLLGVGLTQGYSDQKKARAYVFTGIKVRDGAYSR